MRSRVFRGHVAQGPCTSNRMFVGQRPCPAGSASVANHVCSCDGLRNRPDAACEFAGARRLVESAALPQTPEEPVRVGQTLSSFTITQSLGSGGMGEVYRARDAKLGRDVAIKVLRPEVAGDPDRLARFRREAHVLASLNHPHIAASTASKR